MYEAILDFHFIFLEIYFKNFDKSSMSQNLVEIKIFFSLQKFTVRKLVAVAKIKSGAHVLHENLLYG